MKPNNTPMFYGMRLRLEGLVGPFGGVFLAILTSSWFLLDHLGIKLGTFGKEFEGLKKD